MKKPSRFTKLALVLAALALSVTFLPALRYRKLANHNPLPTSYSKGVYHVHSTFSDGKGDLEEIAAAAASRRLEFVFLCDHGTPNRRAATATRWIGDVLVIGGSELFLEGSHLAASGFAVPDHKYPPEPQEAIDEIVRDGGVSFISHPFFPGYPWTDWTVKNHTGVELINAHTSLSKPRIAKLFMIPRYFARPAFGLLTALEYPAANVAAWEDFNQHGGYSGIFALDAHARMSIGFGRYVHLPTYHQVFELLNVYIKHPGTLDDDAETAARTLVESLRAGSFFNCIEAIAPANGFDAVFESGTGERLEMGTVSTSRTGRLRISLPFDFATDVMVIRNGAVLKAFEHNEASELVVPISDHGVYRVEVSALASSFDHLPWIMSNPFFLVPPRAREEPPPTPVRRVLASGPGFFRAECDPTTRCSLVESSDDDGTRRAELRYELPKSPTTRDYAAALANRAPRSFAGFEGLTLRARAERRARFWLMFRTENNQGEIWYRHSIAVDRDWSTISVPFDRFRVHHGIDHPPDLDDVRSIFISIDNQIAYPGASGTLSVTDLGLF